MFLRAGNLTDFVLEYLQDHGSGRCQDGLVSVYAIFAFVGCLILPTHSLYMKSAAYGSEVGSRVGLK